MGEEKERGKKEAKLRPKAASTGENRGAGKAPEDKAAPGKFVLRLLGLHWLDNLEEELDRCAHSRVLACIGAETVSDAGRDAWTVSAAALFLLRTLARDHTPDAPVGAGQLLPCCGHCMWHEPGDADTLVMGCAHGVDWQVRHRGGQVELTSAAGTSVSIPPAEYRRTVLAFVDEVERFYQRSKPKEPYTDAYDAAGYAHFWVEWRRLREQYPPAAPAGA